MGFDLKSSIIKKVSLQVDNSILKSKLMLGGRRNLLDTIDSLKVGSNAKSKLVVLNPVLEDLKDVVEVKQPDQLQQQKSLDVIKITNQHRSNMSDILEIVKEPVKPSSHSEHFFHPEGRNAARQTAQPAHPSVLELPRTNQSHLNPQAEPTSQLDQAIASISSDSQTKLNPRSGPAEKLSNKPGGIGFMELDKAIASIAELQKSFFGSNESATQAEEPISPFLPYGSRTDMNVFDENLTPTMHQSVGNSLGK